MEVLRTEIKSLQRGQSDIENRLRKVETSLNDAKLNDFQNKVELKEFIVTAVEEGNNKMNVKIDQFIIETNVRLKTLEEKEHIQAMEKLRQQEVDKKDTKKWLFRLVLAAVITMIITFYGTLYLNQTDLAEDFLEEQKQIEIEKQGEIEKYEQIPVVFIG